MTDVYLWTRFRAMELTVPQTITLAIPVGDELDIRAVRKASAERLLEAMRDAARMVGPVDPERSPTMLDAGYAMGVLASIRSPLARACFKTALGR